MIIECLKNTLKQIEKESVRSKVKYIKKNKNKDQINTKHFVKFLSLTSNLSYNKCKENNMFFYKHFVEKVMKYFWVILLDSLTNSITKLNQ